MLCYVICLTVLRTLLLLSYTVVLDNPGIVVCDLSHSLANYGLVSQPLRTLVLWYVICHTALENPGVVVCYLLVMIRYVIYKSRLNHYGDYAYVLVISFACSLFL